MKPHFNGTCGCFSRIVQAKVLALKLMLVVFLRFRCGLERTAGGRKGPLINDDSGAMDIQWPALWLHGYSLHGKLLNSWITQQMEIYTIAGFFTEPEIDISEHIQIVNTVFSYVVYCSTGIYYRRIWHSSRTESWLKIHKHTVVIY